MSETKKPLPVCGTGSGESGQLSFGEVRLPNPDSIMPRPGAQAVSISSLLLRGSGNAVPLQHLQVLTGLDGRTIRRKIWKERQAGACVCEDNRRGYFLAETVAERDSCARSMLARARAVEQTARAIASAEVDHE